MFKPSRSRIVKYDYEADFDEAAMERVLARALNSGVVTQYDTGRGHIVWFEGPPGQDFCRVCGFVRALLAGSAFDG